MLEAFVILEPAKAETPAYGRGFCLEHYFFSLG
jgi:hypothetical protein